MDLQMMARYPFSTVSQRYVREHGPALGDLITSRAYAGARRLGAERVEEALGSRRVLEHGFSTEAERINELLSYPVARIIVSAIGDERLVRWYAHGEAVLAHERLTRDRSRVLLDLAGELGLGPRGKPGDEALGIHFTRFIGPASAFRDGKWKLINREVDRGWVMVSTGELARLCLEALRARIEAELPLPVPLELVSGFSGELERVREALEKRKEDIEEASLGKASITKMPPCMKELMAQTQGGVNIPHMGRFAIAAFLHHIGLSSEDILAVFSASPDFNPDLARYQVEHISGESSGTEYTPPECDTMRTHGLCTGPDTLCQKPWMNHPLTYYRSKDRQERRKLASSGQRRPPSGKEGPDAPKTSPAGPKEGGNEPVSGEGRGTTPYFAYGSNLDVTQMAKRGVSYTRARPAVLKGFRLDFTAHSDSWGGGVADVVDDPGGVVEGALYDVTQGMEALDGYEGVAEGFYRRRWVEVLAAGKPVRALLYEVCDKLPDQPPSHRYMAAIIRGGWENDLSEAYMERLGRIRTID